jgi:hypothetical protein
MSGSASKLWTQFTNVPLFEVNKSTEYRYTIQDKTFVSGFTVIHRLILELTDFKDLKKRESNLELLTNIIKVDKSLLENTLSNGFSPLFLAIINELLDVTQLLLENGANVNYMINGTKDDINAMTLCVKYNHSRNRSIKLMELLIKYKVNCNINNGRESNPIISLIKYHHAIDNFQTKIELLIKQVDPNIVITNTKGMNLLHVLWFYDRKCSTSIFSSILNVYSKEIQLEMINVKYANKFTLLVHAYFDINEDTTLCKFLIENGADTTELLKIYPDCKKVLASYGIHVNISKDEAKVVTKEANVDQVVTKEMAKEKLLAEISKLISEYTAKYCN